MGQKAILCPEELWPGNALPAERFAPVRKDGHQPISAKGPHCRAFACLENAVAFGKNYCAVIIR